MPESNAGLVLLKEINDKTDRTDRYLKDLAVAMQELAVTMASLKTSNEHVQKQQNLQKEVDEHQNFKIDCIESDVHDIEKKLIPVESKVESLEKKVESQESILKELVKGQNDDFHNWKTLKGISSFVFKFIVPPLATAFGSVFLFMKSGGGS